MLQHELVGRRVRVLAWYDHARLVAALRSPAPPQGTITEVRGHCGEPSVSVRIAGLGGTYDFKLNDVELLNARHQ